MRLQVRTRSISLQKVPRALFWRIFHSGQCVKSYILKLNAYWLKFITNFHRSKQMSRVKSLKDCRSAWANQRTVQVQTLITIWLIFEFRNKFLGPSVEVFVLSLRTLTSWALKGFSSTIWIYPFSALFNRINFHCILIFLCTAFCLEI